VPLPTGNADTGNAGDGKDVESATRGEDLPLAAAIAAVEAVDAPPPPLLPSPVVDSSPALLSSEVGGSPTLGNAGEGNNPAGSGGSGDLGGGESGAVYGWPGPLEAVDIWRGGVECGLGRDVDGFGVAFWFWFNEIEGKVEPYGLGRGV
jgi:hypothetical protein